MQTKKKVVLPETVPELEKLTLFPESNEEKNLEKNGRAIFFFHKSKRKRIVM